MMKLVRNTDPITSHMAAEHAVGFSVAHRAMILAALKQHGSMTAHEIARHIPGLLAHQILKRLPELYREEKIAPTGELRRTNRHMARVWEVT